MQRGRRTCSQRHVLWSVWDGHLSYINVDLNVRGCQRVLYPSTTCVFCDNEWERRDEVYDYSNHLWKKQPSRSLELLRCDRCVCIVPLEILGKNQEARRAARNSSLRVLYSSWYTLVAPIPSSFVEVATDDEDVCLRQIPSRTFLAILQATCSFLTCFTTSLVSHSLAWHQAHFLRDA